MVWSTVRAEGSLPKVGADPNLVGQQRRVQLDVVNARIDTVDDQVGVVAQPVAGEVLADHGRYRRTGHITVDHEIRDCGGRPACPGRHA